jgi:stage 0 sporulation protein B (sporulation initiation phosphotransferase)
MGEMNLENQPLDPSFEEEDKLLESLRHQRHDWLNHFQVLLGYLKLGRYDFCEEYIRKVTENTNRDSRVAQLGYKPLVVYLLTFNALHKEIVLEVDLPKIIDLAKFPQLDRNQTYELIKGMIEIYQKHAQSEDGSGNMLEVGIQIVGDFLYISTEFEGTLDEEGCLASIHSLVDQLGNEEGFFVEGLHNKQESIMEFYIPLMGRKR